MIIQKTFENDDAKIYIVSTPIGNLEDITLRAINTLKQVDLIYCEDTRTTIKLLNHFEIKTKMKSYHLFNENTIKEEIVQNVKRGLNVAIVSDAGSPGISDPGWSVINQAIKDEVDVVVIPGVSASLMALVGSGLSTKKYLFYGFLSPKSGKKEEEIRTLSAYSETIIIYESPHRIVETLQLIDQVMPNREIVLARELTKRHEEYIRGKASEVLEDAKSIKGEIVLIVEGNQDSKLNKDLISLSIHEHYQFYTNQGFDSKTAQKQVALDRDVPKREIYQVLFGKDKIK